MKTSILIFAIILVNVFTLKTTAQNRKSHFKSVQISAKVMYYNEAMMDYAVIIYSEGIKVDSIFIDDSEEFNMLFFVNQSYTFVFKKMGYQSKTIVVDATLPEGLKTLSKKATKIEINMTPTLGNSSYITKNDTDIFIIDENYGV
jgi:hypothetical protein